MLNETCPQFACLVKICLVTSWLLGLLIVFCCMLLSSWISSTLCTCWITFGSSLVFDSLNWAVRRNFRVWCPLTIFENNDDNDCNASASVVPLLVNFH